MKTITMIKPASGRATAAKTRVAAYCRVSTGMDDQLVSLETQKSHYEDLISSNPEWEFAGLYYDEGISGTSKEKCRSAPTAFSVTTRTRMETWSSTQLRLKW